ncbi:MAG TPA: cysteine desulfurase [Anaerolineae bacterium]|nr:cysteine desulfurase [Anaerolineae bacterium]
MNLNFDFNSVRAGFPILSCDAHPGKRLVYLDNSATSQKPTLVIEAINDYYRHTNANIHRGIHALAEEATAMYEHARANIASFIGLQNPSEIIFTRNTTESINLVANSWGKGVLKKEDNILLTEMEHHSNLVPWYMLSENVGFKINFIPITPGGLLDLEKYESLLRLGPKLVAFTHMSNVLGTINPAKDITQKAHDVGAIVLLDGAQSVPHFPVDIVDIGADFLAFSAHKMCGPTGIGVLYGRKKLLESMAPFLGGGNMIKKVTQNSFTMNEVPHKFEAGTPAIAEAVGFSAAVDYLNAIGMKNISAYERELTAYGMEKLESVKGVNILGPKPEKRGGVFAFSLEGLHPHDVAQILDREGIAVRAGHHCAMLVHQKYEVFSTTRASLYFYNNEEDIDSLIKGIEKVKVLFA